MWYLIIIGLFQVINYQNKKDNDSFKVIRNIYPNGISIKKRSAKFRSPLSYYQY